MLYDSKVLFNIVYFNGIDRKAPINNSHIRSELRKILVKNCKIDAITHIYS